MVASSAEEGVFAVVVTGILSLFGGALSYSLVCAEQRACITAGTCYALSKASWGCGFQNSVTPTEWRLLNTSAQADALQLANRGICPPGTRQDVDPALGCPGLHLPRNFARDGEQTSLTSEKWLDWTAK